MSDEIIEGEAVDVTPQTSALTVRQEQSAALWEIGTLSDEEFEGRMQMLTLGVERVKQLQRSLLVKDVDWGSIPGTKRDMLFKSGAERLCAFYRLVPEFEQDENVVSVVIDHETGEMLDRITYVTRCRLHHGSQDGPVVGEGVGVCSTFERKYLYRTGQRSCPECGQATVRKGKEEFGGGWYCDRNKGGCGNLKASTSGRYATDASRAKAAELDKQAVGDVINRDPWDMANTVAKMSAKRAHTDATIRSLGVSGLFTQDDDAPTGQRAEAGDPYGGGEDWAGMVTEAPMNTIANAQPATRATPPRQSRTRQRQERAAAKAEEAVATEVAEVVARDQDDGFTAFDDPEVDHRAEGERGATVSFEGEVIRARWDLIASTGNPYARLIVRDGDTYYHVFVPSTVYPDLGWTPGEVATTIPGVEGQHTKIDGRWSRIPEGYVVVADGVVL